MLHFSITDLDSRMNYKEADFKICFQSVPHTVWLTMLAAYASLGLLVIILLILLLIKHLYKSEFIPELIQTYLMFKNLYGVIWSKKTVVERLAHWTPDQKVPAP